MLSTPELKEPLRQITNVDDVPTFATVVASAFSNDALNRYLFLGRDSRPDHPKLQQFELRVHYWEKVIRPRYSGGAVLIQSHDWAAVALWFPPGVEKSSPADTSILSEGVLEYFTFFGNLRKEKLGTRLHWHLNIIGRDPKRDDQGAVTAIFTPFLNKAREGNLPVWLEATNAHARDVYKHFGFQVVGEAMIGKGIVGNDGWAKDDGEGVQAWGMIAGLNGW